MNTAGLTLSGISKRYKGETVLDAIDLSVSAGKTLVLFGPSGGGKTVLLRLIAGVIEPDSGTVLVDGRDITHEDPEKRGIGMAFQNFALFPHMSAERNIASSLEVHETSSTRLAEAVRSVAKLLKIEHVLDHAPKALSNGQKQRTALARALVGKPSVVLLDDPLRNVDAKLRFEMRLELPNLLAEQGTTVVYVTQDYKEAMALGNQIAVLVGGRIQQLGTPEDIYTKPATIDIARQFGDPTINLLDVDVAADTAGEYIIVSGKRIDLPTYLPSVVNQPLTIGIRPETVEFTEPSSPDAMTVNVEAVTPLNEKVVTLLVTSGGREILASQPATMSVQDSGKAAIRINPEHIHFFHRDSGQRIDSDDSETGAHQ